MRESVCVCVWVTTVVPVYARNVPGCIKTAACFAHCDVTRERHWHGDLRGRLFNYLQFPFATQKMDTHTHTQKKRYSGAILCDLQILELDCRSHPSEATVFDAALRFDYSYLILAGSHRLQPFSRRCSEKNKAPISLAVVFT